MSYNRSNYSVAWSCYHVIRYDMSSSSSSSRSLSRTSTSSSSSSSSSSSLVKLEVTIAAQEAFRLVSLRAAGVLPSLPNG